MSRHFALAEIAALCLGLFFSYPSLNNQARAQGKSALAEPKITVLSPLGTPPLFAEIKQKANAVIMGLGH